MIAVGEPGPQGVSTALAVSNETVVGNTTLGNYATGLIYNPNDHRVYVTLYGPNQVDVLSISGTQVIITISVGEGPSALVYNPSNESVYVVNSGFGAPGSVSVLSGS